MLLEEIIMEELESVTLLEDDFAEELDIARLLEELETTTLLEEAMDELDFAVLLLEETITGVIAIPSHFTSSIQR